MGKARVVADQFIRSLALLLLCSTRSASLFLVFTGRVLRSCWITWRLCLPGQPSAGWEGSQLTT